MQKRFEYVRFMIDDEGFDYCFREYSFFPDIEDEKFHELRKQYINIANELEEYRVSSDLSDIYLAGIPAHVSQYGIEVFNKLIAPKHAQGLNSHPGNIIHPAATTEYFLNITGD